MLCALPVTHSLDNDMLLTVTHSLDNDVLLTVTSVVTVSYWLRSVGFGSVLS